MLEFRQEGGVNKAALHSDSHYRHYRVCGEGQTRIPVVKSQLCKVVNSIPALQISVIYPGDFSEEQQGSGVPILISFHVGY